MQSLQTMIHNPDTHRRIALATGLLLAAICVWFLLRLLWLLITPLPDVSAWSAIEQQSQQPAQSLSGPPVSDWPLFGDYTEQPVIAALREAPQTKLDLQLRGIVSSGDPESGFAIIVDQGRQGVFGIEQSLSSGATVKAVYPDRVVLLHDGRYETLRLPGDRTVDTGTSALPVAQASTSSDRPMMVDPGLVTNQLSLNINSLAAGYGLLPVNGGGYRLSFGRNARQLADLGLRNGDIILAANGIRLNDQGDVEAAMAQVLGGERLTLLVRRGAEELSLTADITELLGQGG